MHGKQAGARATHRSRRSCRSGSSLVTWGKGRLQGVDEQWMQHIRRNAGEETHLGAVAGRCTGARPLRLGRRGVGATEAPTAVGADLDRFSLNHA